MSNIFRKPITLRLCFYLKTKLKFLSISNPGKSSVRIELRGFPIISFYKTLRSMKTSNRNILILRNTEAKFEEDYKQGIYKRRVTYTETSLATGGKAIYSSLVYFIERCNFTNGILKKGIWIPRP